MAEKAKSSSLGYVGTHPIARRPPRDPQWRHWRNLRILLRVGLFVLLAPPSIYVGRNLVLFGKPTTLSPADFVPTVQNIALPTVRAMKEYERDTGHLPDRMDDLIPKYLQSPPMSFAQRVGDSGYELFTKYNQVITYDFKPGAEGWSVHGPFANGPIPVPPVTILPTAKPSPSP